MKKINLLFDFQLRGVVFENAGRILLRRIHKNNFIFCCRYFDSIDEIINKYRLNHSSFEILINHLRKNGLHTDLIEFVLDNTQSRVITKINFYDVKSKMHNSKRDYCEMCISDYEFMKKIGELGCGTFILHILLFNDWNFEFQIHPFNELKMRIYNSSIKQTLFFSGLNESSVSPIKPQKTF